jgi:hypothetical protein
MYLPICSVCLSHVPNTKKLLKCDLIQVSWRHSQPYDNSTEKTLEYDLQKFFQMWRGIGMYV